MDLYRPIWPLMGQVAALAMLKNPKASVQSAKLYDIQVRFLKDDVAMVTGTLAMTGSGAGKTLKVIYRSTDILVERSGKWLVAASLVTPVKDLR